MDHVPMPSSPIHDQIQVPLRCVPTSDLSVRGNAFAFSDYPKNQGRDIGAILIGDIGPDPDVVETFLQQWLYFGLIHEVVNSCGPVLTTFEDFVYVGDHGIRYVTSKSLPTAIERWRQAKERLTLEDQTEIAERIDNVLAEARYFISRLTVLALSCEIDLPISESILLSIVILGETLECSKSNIFKPRSMTGAPAAHMNFWGNRHELGHLLRTDGCCPNHVLMLEATVSAATMYYAYLGGLSLDQKDHGQCDAQKCLAYQIDPSTYLTTHTSTQCDCSFIEPPMQKVRAILSRGGVPVISFVSPVTFSDLIDIDVVQAAAGTKYVAISHVWSDGLGNPRSNSLPHCQLQRLRNLAATFYIGEGMVIADHVVIWIDTLCIPLEEPLRGRAIELIQTTFQQASEVLVLDNRLGRLSSKVSYTENMMRVMCCGWLRRLWTFMEGAIAPKLFFSFHDEMVEVSVWMLKRFKDPSTTLWNMVSIDASQFWWLLRRLHRMDSSQRVARLWNALQWRSTSRVSDECICVASLFGLNVSDIVNTPAEFRMKKLLEMQQWFPPGIIFMNSTRLNEEGLGWAPASFLARQPNDLGLIIDDKPPVCVGEKGLFVQYPGMTLTVSKSPLSATFLLVDDESRSVYVVMWQDEEAGKNWQQVGCHNMKQPALILRHNLLPLPETVGLLVDIMYDDDDCLYVRYPTRVAVRAEAAVTYDSHQKALVAEADMDVDEYLYASSNALPENQQWCVG